MGKPEQVLDPSMEEILASIRKIIAEDSGPASPVRQAPQLAVVQEPSDDAESDPEPTLQQPAKRDSEAFEIRAQAPESLLKPTQSDSRPEPRVRGVPLAPDRDHEVRESARPTPADEAAANVAQLRDAASREKHDTIRSEAAADSAIRQMAGMNDRPERIEASQLSEPRREATGGRSERMHSTEAKAAPADQTDAQSLLSPRADEAVQSAFDQLAHTILGNQTRTLEDLVQELLRPMLRNWLDDNLPVLVERLVREEIERVSRGRR